MNHFALQEKNIYDSRLGRSFASSQDHVKAFLRIFWIIQKKKALRTSRIQIQDAKISLCQHDLIPNLNIGQLTLRDNRVPTFVVSAGLFCF